MNTNRDRHTRIVECRNKPVRWFGNRITFTDDTIQKDVGCEAVGTRVRHVATLNHVTTADRKAIPHTCLVNAFIYRGGSSC
jgi:hypothetical protein